MACTDKEFALNELKVQPHGAMLEAKADRDSCLNTPSTSQPSPPCMSPIEIIAGMQVACTDKEFALNELKVQPHGGMLEAMAGSVFCLIMPGNSQSSQRLTEAFIAGCIPVFLGPPWHTLPFSTEASPWQTLPSSLDSPWHTLLFSSEASLLG